MLAHAGSPDESLAMLLLAAGVWTGWAGLSRIRGKEFARVPVIGAWALGVAGVGLIVGGRAGPARALSRDGNRSTNRVHGGDLDRPAHASGGRGRVRAEGRDEP